MPCSGPRTRPLLRSPSSTSAIAPRVGVDLEDAAKLGAAAVDGLDPRQVLLDERTRGVLAGFHAALQVGDAGFLEVEGRDAGRLRGERDGGQGNRDDQSFPVIHGVSFARSVTTSAHTMQPIMTAAPRNCAMFAIR